ncbi:MAG: NAD-dependent epimerase/dehydratase family protein [Egibacteraceae bacterium]
MSEGPALRRVVVTGGAGFIGANLVRHLVETEAAEQVVVLDDLSSGAEANLAGLSRTELLIGSVLDDIALTQACRGADAVVHLAARPSVPKSVEEPLASNEVNAAGTLKVLEAARAAGGLHTIVASSAAVYGPNPAQPKQEELAPEPVSPYAASKLASEAYCRAYAACYGLPVLPFRFFNVFGPLQTVDHVYAAVIPAFIDAAVHGRPLMVHGDGAQTRDFVFVGTVCALLIDALRRGVTSAAPVNLAFGSRRTLLELIATLESVVGRELDVEHTAPRPGDVRDSQADQRRLLALFPDARPTPFDEALRTTVEWYAQLNLRT